MTKKTKPVKRGRGRPRKNPVEVLEKSIETGKDIPQMENLLDVTKLSKLNVEYPTTAEEVNRWGGELSNEINRLDKELGTVDKEYAETRKILKRIELDRQKISTRRDSLISKIRTDQNKIFRAEEILQKIPRNFYTADFPGFLRSILNALPFYNDEISLRTKIAEAEAKIAQRNNRVVNINSQLAQVIMAYTSYQNSSHIINDMAESYRAARSDLGKIQREFDLKYQESSNQAEQNEIISHYRNTMEKLNSVKTEFQNSASENKEKTQAEFSSLSNQFTGITNLLNKNSSIEITDTE